MFNKLTNMRFFSTELKVFIILTLSMLMPYMSYAEVSDGTDGSASSLDPYEVGYDFEADGIYYKITSDSTVSTSEGEKEYHGAIVIPDVVEYNKKTYKITKVSGFRHSPYVTEVTIPKYTDTISGFYFRVCNLSGGPGVKSVEKDSIDDTRDTSVVTIPSSLRKVYFNADNCKNVYFSIHTTTMLGGGYEGFSSPFPSTLKEIEFGENVERIPNGLLYGCEKIEKLVFPKSVKYIGWMIIREKSDNINYCELQCSDLQEIGWLPKNRDCVELCSSFKTYPCGIEHYISQNVATGIHVDATRYSSVFHNFIDLKPNAGGKVDLPKWVQKIAPNAFATCEFKLNLNIPETITSIDANTFSNCLDLEAITIPKTVSYIGVNAFQGCSNLKSLYFDSENCVVESGAFSDCDSLTNVTFGDSVTKVPDYLLSWCNGLKKLELPNHITKIGEGSFMSSGITELIIPSSISVIKDFAFNSCKKLSKINFNSEKCVIGNSVFAGCGEYIAEFDKDIKKIPENIFYGSVGLKNVIIHEGVTEIGRAAFQQTGITEVTIPTTVVNMSDAFTECNNLTTVYYNASKSTGRFYKCNSLSKVVFGDFVEIIPENFCLDCKALQEIQLSESVSEIGEMAFAGTNLTSVTIPKNVTKIGYSALATYSPASLYYDAKKCQVNNSFGKYFYEVLIGNNVEKIPSYFLNDCENITQITIPKNVKIIGGFAFSFCDNLKTIYYNAEDCETEIASNNTANVFWTCNSLEDVCVGEGVKRIPDNLFAECRGLKNINIPNTVTEIGDYTFYSTALKEVIIPNNIAYLGVKSFSFCSNLKTLYFNAEDCDINSEDVFSNCDSLVNVEFGETVTKIPVGLFYYCRNLSKVLLPNSITEIGANAFNGTALNDIVIPNNVTMIGERAFQHCYSLYSITIGKSVQEIGSLAFGTCTNARLITSLNQTPPNITEDVFSIYTYNYGSLNAPINSIDAYKNAIGWKNFKSYTGIDISSVENISINENAKPIYYNLQGIKVDNPQKGLFIKCERNKTSKVVID